MEYRRLGKTGWKISAIGFGGIPIQRNSSEEAIAIIEAAVKMGINFFDTARGYEDSERKIGWALENKDRKQFVLATKSRARSKLAMAKDIEDSLKDLQTDYIDLYQCHNIKTEDEYQQVFAEQGALVALNEAKKQGKIRSIGISSHNHDILLKAMATGAFDTAQFPFNYIEQDKAFEVIALAEKLDMGTIVMKPLAGGALSNASAALRFILQHHISVVIPGMDSIEQVGQNSLVGEGTYKLTAEEEKSLTEEAQVLGQEFCRRCGYCQPCQVGIDIPSSFILDSYFQRYSLPEWAAERYQSQQVLADQCIHCGECETRCPYNLPIREMLTKVHHRLGKS